MTQTDLQTAFNLITQDDTLIYGVLKDLHVQRQRSNFADLYQIGVIAFVEAYEQFPGDVETETPTGSWFTLIRPLNGPL